jgi:2Fe-2S ferredoxin
MPRLTITNREQQTVQIEATTGISVMENIRELNASVEAICGGMCACATCHVYIDPDCVAALPPRSYEETVMLRELESFNAETSRLSCQLKTTDECDGLRLIVAPEE